MPIHFFFCSGHKTPEGTAPSMYSQTHRHTDMGLPEGSLDLLLQPMQTATFDSRILKKEGLPGESSRGCHSAGKRQQLLTNWYGNSSIF